METIITILAIICGSIILSDQIVPLEEIKNWLNAKYGDVTDPWKLRIVDYTNHLFNCSSCISFWLVLIIMGSLKYALIAYVAAAIIKRIMTSYNV